MPLDDVRTRLVNEIHLRGYDDKYIDRNEEREILQIAIQLGVAVEAARADLAAVCAAEGYIQETAVVRAMSDQLATMVGKSGRVDRGAFERVLADAVRRVQGKKTDREVKKMLVTVMEDTGQNRVKAGWFRNWYKAVKREVGVA